MSKSNRRAAEIGGTGRWSARRKAEAVLRLLKGEDLDTLSRQLKVTAATLSEWREVFLANALAGLKSREVDGRDEKIAALEKALAETAYSDARLTEEIRTVLAASAFLGEGYRKVWAKLRFQGLRTSRIRVLRLMREAGLLAPSRAGGPRGPRSHDGTIIPEHPNTMWGADLTTTMTTEEGQVAVFIAIDHATAEPVGVHAAKRATRSRRSSPSSASSRARRSCGCPRATAAPSG